MTDRPAILVIDGHTFIRTFLVGLLEGANYRVRSAADARAAQGILAEWLPAVVVADAIIPDMDGRALLAAIREHERRIGLVLISRGQRDVSGYGVPIITMPFRAAQVLEVVAQEIARARTADPGE